MDWICWFWLKLDRELELESGAQRRSCQCVAFTVIQLLYIILDTWINGRFYTDLLQLPVADLCFLNLDALLIFTRECKTIIIFAHWMTMNLNRVFCCVVVYIFNGKQNWMTKAVCVCWWKNCWLIFCWFCCPLFVCLFIQYVLYNTISHAPSPFGPNVERVYVCTRVYVILFAIKLFVRRRFIYISRSFFLFFRTFDLPSNSVEKISS